MMVVGYATKCQGMGASGLRPAIATKVKNQKRTTNRKKQNEANKAEQNRTKPNETKRNKTNRNETKRKWAQVENSGLEFRSHTSCLCWVSSFFALIVSQCTELFDSMKQEGEIPAEAVSGIETHRRHKYALARKKRIHIRAIGKFEDDRFINDQGHWLPPHRAYPFLQVWSGTQLDCTIFRGNGKKKKKKKNWQLTSELKRATVARTQLIAYGSLKHLHGCCFARSTLGLSTTMNF